MGLPTLSDKMKDSAASVSSSAGSSIPLRGVSHPGYTPYLADEEADATSDSHRPIVEGRGSPLASDSNLPSQCRVLNSPGFQEDKLLSYVKRRQVLNKRTV